MKARSGEDATEAWRSAVRRRNATTITHKRSSFLFRRGSTKTLHQQLQNMAEEAAAHHLLNVLEERDLSVDLDKILAVFESDETKTAAAAWVNEYLNEETLLTKEELEL